MNAIAASSATSRDDERPKQWNNEKVHLNKVQQELINVQMKYQKEIERLESENKELRKQMMLRKEKTPPSRRKVKVGVNAIT